MTILLSRIVPRDQLVVVHAPLGEVDWPRTVAHIELTIPAGVPFILAPVASGKTLLDRIEERGMFPSNSARWCTSDAKRSPIERELRRYLKAHPRFGGLIVSAMGMRAAESPARSKLAPWKRNSRNSKAGREWFDWLPIHALETPDVFRIIREAGQSPHWAYAAGMSRGELQLLHSGLACRSAPGGRTSPRSLRALRGLGAAHRPHTVTVTQTSARIDRYPRRSRQDFIVPGARHSRPQCRRTAGHLSDGVAALRTGPFPRPRGSRDGGASSRDNRPSCASSRSRRPRIRRSRR